MRRRLRAAGALNWTISGFRGLATSGLRMGLDDVRSISELVLSRPRLRRLAPKIRTRLAVRPVGDCDYAPWRRRRALHVFRTPGRSVRVAQAALPGLSPKVDFDRLEAAPFLLRRVCANVSQSLSRFDRCGREHVKESQHLSHFGGFGRECGEECQQLSHFSHFGRPYADVFQYLNLFRRFRRDCADASHNFSLVQPDDREHAEESR